MLRRIVGLGLLFGMALVTCGAAAGETADATTAAAPTADLAALREAFVSPPREAGPYTWWHWIDDNIGTAGITRDLEAMHDAGFAGAQIFNVGLGLPAGNVPFMSPPWKQAMAHAFAEAERLGLDVGVHNCAGWSSSGGAWIDAAHSMQTLTFSTLTLQGPSTFHGPLPLPEHKLDFYRDIALLAIPLKGEPQRLPDWKAKACYVDRTHVDMPAPASLPRSDASALDPAGVPRLDARLDAKGQLSWQVPAGNWLLLRLGHTTTGKTNHPATAAGTGLECDKLSTAAMQMHWGGMMKEALEAAGPRTGKAFGNAIVDSYEVFAQNWTPGLEQDFASRRGYALQPWLPALAGYVVASPDATERFLYDFRRTLAELFDERYYAEFGRLARAHGLRFYTEPYGNGNFDSFGAGATADVPMGEFWTTGAAAETVKLAASVAHAGGKPLVAAESFTAVPEFGRWLNSPASFKVMGDRMFCLGLTQMVFHRYAHQPWADPVAPGMTMGPWGSHIERTNTWWEFAPAWFTYLARCQWMLRQGRAVADIAVLNDSPSAGISGALANRPDYIPQGHDFDLLGEAALRAMHVEDHWLVLPSGARYRVLLLPETPWLRTDLAERLAELVRQGAWIAGPRPQRSPSLVGGAGGEQRLQTVVDSLWGEAAPTPQPWRTVGQGRVYLDRPTAAMLADARLAPDCALHDAEAAAAPTAAPDQEGNFIHRQAPQGEIYFVANPRPRPLSLTAGFRVGGRAPELWDAVTGQHLPAPVYQSASETTTIPLRLEAGASLFVVFPHAAAATGGPRITRALFTPSEGPAPAERRHLQIVQASYGTRRAEHRIDVTERLRTLSHGGHLAGHVMNDWLGGDPHPNKVKTLHVTYELDGQRYEIDRREGDWLEIPAADPAPTPPPFDFAASPQGAPLLRQWQAGELALVDDAGTTRSLGLRQVPAPLELRGPWAVRFDAGGGAPAETTFTTLVDWARHPDPAIRHFSGGATYTLHFDWQPAPAPPHARLVYALDLGQVQVIARAKLNGQTLGITWLAPHRLAIPEGLLRPGANTLQVRVKNLWVNRLIGDEQLPADVDYNKDNAMTRWPAWLTQGTPRTSGRLAFSTWHHWKQDDPLQPSGLIGPVLLRSAATCELAGR